jgi:2,3-diaminopropionate biosynthesis protein SbnB
MRDGDILILKGDEVASLLAGRESDLIRIMRNAYEAHARGLSSLPHSTFLHFSETPRNRIIALPAYLGAEFQVAGIKWVASFPDNLERGLDRGSAVVILNSTSSGRPIAIIEASHINAKRTAASAALAARTLREGERVDCIAAIGCGFVNFETIRFLKTAFPALSRLVIFDLNPNRAIRFKQKCLQSLGSVEVDIVDRIEKALSASPLISMATTATTPHISDLSYCVTGATILHISLRDLSPEVILACDNIVDDVDHVCRAQTSVHLAEQLGGSRDFIRCTLADITMGKTPPRKDASSISIFSPFGLGILDMAVSKFVYHLAIESGQGITISSFLPDSWLGSATNVRLTQ